MGAEKRVVMDTGRTREEVWKDIWAKVSPLAEGTDEPVSGLRSSVF